jgi:hypothetical protein
LDQWKERSFPRNGHLLNIGGFYRHFDV